jgi:hypothetical protein
MEGGIITRTLKLGKKQRKMIMSNKKNEEGIKEGKGKDKLIEDTEMENEEDKIDSDDSGPYFDDFMSPGGRHFTFGDFQNTEVQNILKMRINERTVAIHEYGTNMLKNNYDPLAVIEAKLAMNKGKIDCGSNETTNKVNATCEQVEGPVPTNPSPQTGTQEAPAAEWSSQEDNARINLEVAENIAGKGKTTQMSPNWEEVEEDTDKEDPSELEGDRQKDSVFGGDAENTDAEEDGDSLAAPWEGLEEESDREDLIDLETDTQENLVNEGDRQMETSVTEDMEDINKENTTPEKITTRQSQRIKEQGLGAINITEKAVFAAQKKNLEGNHLNLKNSFAVLSNNELVTRSRKMGVNVGEADLEKFDILKDLERARANLKERLNSNDEKDKEKNEENLPLEEMKYLEWKSEASEEENFHLVTSRRKKKNKRRMEKQKKEHPVGRGPILLMRPYPLQEGYLDLALSITSRKVLPGVKFLKMIGVIWNCRGVGKKGIAVDIKNLLTETGVDFIGLQETMKRKYTDKFFRNIDPNRLYAWHWLPSQGRSGGILCGIKKENFDIIKVIEHEFAVEAEVWDKKVKISLRLITIYGPAHEERRDQFLRELSTICAKNDLPMIVGGDFNILRYSNEKKNFLC